MIERNALTSAITENAPVGIYVLGSDLRYRWANRTYMGYLPEPYRWRDLAGMPFVEVIPSAFELGVMAELEQVSRTGVPLVRREREVKGVSGELTWWRSSIVALRGGDEKPPYDLLVVISNETERKRAELALLESRERYRNLYEQRKRLETELRRHEEQARHILEHAPAPVYQIDFRGPRFVSVNELMCQVSGYSREELLRMSPFKLLDKNSAARLAKRLREASAGEQPAESIDYTSITKDGRRLSVSLDVSFLFEAGKPVGALVVGHDVTERKRMEEEREQATERLSRVLNSITAGYYELDRDWRFTQANPEAQKHLGASEEELRGRCLWDVIGGAPGQDTYEQFQTAKREQRPAHFEARSEVHPDKWAELHLYPTQTGLEVYLRDISRRKLTERELQRSEERQAFLLGLSDVLRALADPVVMQQRAARMLGEHLGADRVYFGEASMEEDLAVVPPDYFREDLPSIAGRHRMSDLPGSFRVLKTGRPFSIVDVDTSGRLSERSRAAYRAWGLGSFAAVPLIKGGKTVWSVNVAFLGRHRWSKEEIALMREVGDRTWSAVERAAAEAALRESEEKHRALAEENERLYRQQLNIAENLQLALLNIPSEIGPVKLGHLYRSATEAARVGGDFYDVWEVKEGSIAILIGDVAGHGIQAARTATLVKDVVHAFTHQSLRTHKVLRRTNLLLIEKELPGFVTVFLGILDRNNGRLRYSSAGHPETLLRRASGSIERLGCGFSPLGVYPDVSWRASEVDLQVDDLLILYTDGVIEARRGTELFGEKRLERLVRRRRLSPQRLPHLVLDQVLAFAGGNLEDDVAILALSLTSLDEPQRLPYKQGSLLG